MNFMEKFVGNGIEMRFISHIDFYNFFVLKLYYLILVNLVHKHSECNFDLVNHFTYLHIGNFRKIGTLGTPNVP
jgi:hypothetical protein